MSYIEELQEVIRRLHGVDSHHVESVPVKETLHGRTIWEGIVEVFELHGHPTAPKVYAWARSADGPKKRHVTVLHVGPITSAVRAVQAIRVQDFKNELKSFFEQAEES